MKDLRPLLADVDLDIRAPEGQVGAALIEDQGLHLPEPGERSHEDRDYGAIGGEQKQFRLIH